MRRQQNGRPCTGRKTGGAKKNRKSSFLTPGVANLDSAHQQGKSTGSNRWKKGGDKRTGQRVKECRLKKKRGRDSPDGVAVFSSGGGKGGGEEN